MELLFFTNTINDSMVNLDYLDMLLTLSYLFLKVTRFRVLLDCIQQPMAKQRRQGESSI